MEGILTEAHTTFTAQKATSQNSQDEGGEWRAFMAYKATSHANNTGQRRKEGTVSMGSERKKRLILGAGGG